jgi:hypothetical protein
MTDMITPLSELWAQKKQYTGILAEPMVMGTGKELIESFRTIPDRIAELYRQHGLDADTPHAKDRLILALARQFIPGFQFHEREKLGRRPTSVFALAQLIDDVTRLKEKGLSVRSACKCLAGHGRYRTFSTEAIRSRYHTATRGGNKAAVDAYFTHRDRKKGG